MLTRAASSRYLMTIFYVFCFILALGCFYFSISEWLFSWLFPDELAAASAYQGLGLFGCAKHYYLQTTINRASAGLGVCLMAQGATLLSTPFIGWVFVRLIFYVLTPVSIAFLLKEVVKIPFKFGVSAAFIISAIAIFIIADNNLTYMFGLDLAIYAMATFTFFTLIALFPKSIQSDFWFVAFCLVYAFNLNSHEVFLPISGFFLLLYAWYRYALVHHVSGRGTLRLFVNSIWKDRKVQILSAIYLISALVTLLAPGMAMRQHIWPSKGTFLDGIVHMLLSVEETTYFITKLYLLVTLTFLLGAVFRFSVVNKDRVKNTLLYVFLFSAPFIYLLVIGFLLGITPNLRAGSHRTEAFRVIEPLLIHIESFLTNRSVLVQQGGFGVRQYLFLYVGLFLDFFLAGFFIAGVIAKRYLRGMVAEKTGLCSIALLLVVAIVFFFHPDGIGSIRALFVLSKNKEAQLNSSAFFTAFPTPNIQALNDQLFPRNRTGNHESAVVNRVTDNYLKLHRGKGLTLSALDQVYEHMIAPYRLEEVWNKQIYAMYGVPLKEACSPFFKEPLEGSFCSNTFEEAEITDLLAHKKMETATSIHLDRANGVEVKLRAANGMQLTDTPTKGEHFVTSELYLSKGLHYFVFEAKPTHTELYIYLTGEKTGILFSWLNQLNKSSPWGKINSDTSLQPIFSQTETLPTVEKLKLIVYSATDQKVHLRWQHSLAGRTGYKGSKKNISFIQNAQFGQIVEASVARNKRVE